MPRRAHCTGALRKSQDACILITAKKLDLVPASHHILCMGTPPFGLYGINPLTGGLWATNSLLGSLSDSPAISALTQPVNKWAYVERRFRGLLNALSIRPEQQEDGDTKQAGVTACLNRHYWGLSSEPVANSMLIGSWGKLTQVRPSRDIDVLFLLPSAVYHRFEQREGNRQSQLLQEVRTVLGETYSQTALRGDGQVIVIPFNTIPIELVPGFRCNDGSIIICDTNNGGRYKICTAEAEALELATSDRLSNGNARALVRMMKQWQREQDVPLKSFCLERLAIEFLTAWHNRDRPLLWYDWMVRDFLAHLIGRADGTLLMPHSNEVIPLGTDWVSRTEAAYQAAFAACDYERDNYGALAGTEWQKIFGTACPILVS